MSTFSRRKILCSYLLFCYKFRIGLISHTLYARVHPRAARGAMTTTVHREEQNTTHQLQCSLTSTHTEQCPAAVAVPTSSRRGENADGRLAHGPVPDLYTRHSRTPEVCSGKAKVKINDLGNVACGAHGHGPRGGAPETILRAAHARLRGVYDIAEVVQCGLVRAWG